MQVNNFIAMQSVLPRGSTYLQTDSCVSGWHRCTRLQLPTPLRLVAVSQLYVNVPRGIRSAAMSDSQLCYFDGKKDFILGRPSDAAAAVLRELQPSMVLFSHDGLDGGSGVALDANHVVTDMHVGLIGRHLQVLTPSGRKLDGYLERLDVIRDLAIVKVRGLAESGIEPAKIVEDDRNLSGKSDFSIGSPVTESPSKAFDCVSEGKTQEVTSLYDFLDNQSRGWAGWLKFLVPSRTPGHFEAYTSFMSKGFGPAAAGFVEQNPEKFDKVAQQWFSLPRIRSSGFVSNGQSGGALATDSGVTRILQFGLDDYPAASFSMPAKDVVTLANSPSRFSFRYDRLHGLQKVEAVDPRDPSAVAEAQLANIIAEQGEEDIVRVKRNQK